MIIFIDNRLRLSWKCRHCSSGSSGNARTSAKLDCVQYLNLLVCTHVCKATSLARARANLLVCRALLKCKLCLSAKICWCAKVAHLQNCLYAILCSCAKPKFALVQKLLVCRALLECKTCLSAKIAKLQNACWVCICYTKAVATQSTQSLAIEYC